MVLGRMMHLGFTAFLTPSLWRSLRLLLAQNFENVEDCRPIIATWRRDSRKHSPAKREESRQAPFSQALIVEDQVTTEGSKVMQGTVLANWNLQDVSRHRSPARPRRIREAPALLARHPAVRRRPDRRSRPRPDTDPLMSDSSYD